jgi:hypothetical protein
MAAVFLTRTEAGRGAVVAVCRSKVTPRSVESVFPPPFPKSGWMARWFEALDAGVPVVA